MPAPFGPMSVKNLPRQNRRAEVFQQYTSAVTDRKVVQLQSRFHRCPPPRLSAITITTGAPKNAVTVLMASSVGENAVRAIQSHAIQNTPPSRKQPGRTAIGLAVPSSFFVIYGTAMPTKEIGPTSAVTHAASRQESPISAARKRRTFTPCSPRNVRRTDMRRWASPAAGTAAGRRQSPPSRCADFPDTAEKLPIDQLVRFAISLSLAKVTKKSVAAEQTLPIIMPTTSSIAML